MSLIWQIHFQKRQVRSQEANNTFGDRYAFDCQGFFVTSPAHHPDVQKQPDAKDPLESLSSIQLTKIRKLITVDLKSELNILL